MTSRRVDGDPAIKIDPPARIVTRLFDRVTDALLGKRPLDPADVDEIRDLDPSFGRPFVSADRMIYRVMHALEGGKVRVEPLLEAARGVGASTALAEAAAYLAFQDAALRHLRERKLDRPDATELAGEVEPLLAILDRIAPGRPALGAHLVNRAKIESLRDREAASALLLQARAAAPGFVEHLRYDYGTSTYLTAREVAGPGPDYPGDVGLAPLRAALAARAPAFADGGTNLIWSCDVRFFRIHGPPWFEVLPYLMRMGMRPVCLMIGEEAEATTAIDAARELIAGIARFRGDPDPDGVARSIVFVRVGIPDFVASPLTFYATARHLHARQVIEETGAPAVIMDIDMTVKEPFGPFLAALATADVAVPFTRGLTALSPWRRYMAGTGWFAATDASLAFLTTVERYIVRGLDREASWMLDQNALAFAIESGAGGAEVSNLNLARRPAGQDELRKQYERQF